MLKEPTNLKQVKKASKYQAIVDHIESLIRQGELKPGDKLLAERVLSEQFGVSRISVRKALAILAGMGLIVTTPRHGAHVAEYSNDQIVNSFSRLVAQNSQRTDDLYEVRRLIEVQVVRLVAIRRTEDDVRELWEAFEQTTADILAGNDPHKADIAFHVSLAQYTSNPFFTELMSVLVTGLIDAFANLWTEGQEDLPETITNQHRQIVQAIADRDPDAAALYVTHHIDVCKKVTE
ncbi:MAG: FadR/GntR family transcriptional regulator [Anaerolineae bacterium]